MINTIKENRVITKKCIEVKNGINIICLTLKSVISEKELIKQYEHFIIHAGFKKQDNIIDINNDDRTTRYYKKICNDDDIDINDFFNLPKKQFFQKYRKITLLKNTIEAVNDYHEQLKIEEIKKKL